jgi:hypothetical protein
MKILYKINDVLTWIFGIAFIVLGLLSGVVLGRMVDGRISTEIVEQWFISMIVSFVLMMICLNINAGKPK